MFIYGDKGGGLYKFRNYCVDKIPGGGRGSEKNTWFMDTPLGSNITSLRTAKRFTTMVIVFDASVIFSKIDKIVRDFNESVKHYNLRLTRKQMV